jgi:multiple sugar transport system permease protein
MADRLLRRLKARLEARLETRPILTPLLLFPTAVLLGGLLAYPLGVGAWLGFHDAHIGDPGAFVGFDNFRYLLTDPVLRLTAFNTLVYTFLTVAVKMSAGLWLAVILNRRFAGYRFWRSVLLLPYIVPTVLSAFAWWWILDPQFSFISWGLRRLGVIQTNIDFLGEPWLARASLMTANVWRGIPFFTIGYLAGLQAIPRELYEAAVVDGARPWRTFRDLTWPLLFPLTLILSTFSAIFTFTDFQLVWTITRGGPANATHLFVTLAYQRGIPGGALGEGAAIAGFTLPFLFVMSWVALGALRREPA